MCLYLTALAPSAGGSGNNSLSQPRIELTTALRERVPNIYPEKNMNQKDTCTPKFIITLFTTAKTWKQPKCPSTEEWIKKMWYIHAMEYYSAIKKNEIMLFEATWMDLESVILSEVSQTEKEKYRMTSVTCGI